MNIKKYAAPDGALFLVLMRLQLWRTYGAEVMEKFFRFSKIALPLAIVAVCLSGYVLHSQSGIFREFQDVLLSLQWMLLVCMAIWCGTFLFLTFSLNDLPLIGVLLIAIAAYFIGYAASQPAVDAIILLAGVTMGKGARVLLNEEFRMKNEESENTVEIVNRKSPIKNFMVGLVVLLAFSAWWHLNLAGTYHGSRWMGLWNNPNIYGMLMGAGLTLAIGLLAEKLKTEKLKTEIGQQKLFRAALCRLLPVFLFLAAGMMAVGLLFSYSRGAWVGTAVGLLYLAKAHGKLKWRWVMLGAGLVALGALCLWGRTADTDAWYLKRLDLSRPSAQHRVSAWRGAVQMMRDHPLGVGWNQAVDVYDKNYSPPEGGAAALTMNSYLMLGTELGLPGLLCFLAYVAPRFRSPKPKVQPPSRRSDVLACREDGSPKLGNDAALDLGHWTLDATQVVCRAGAVALLVAFWFDGGLFNLPTAALFWILLELGAETKPQSRKQKSETNSLEALKVAN
jgi:hypothetical protein